MSTHADMLDGLLTNLRGKKGDVATAKDALREAEYETVKYLADRRLYHLLKLDYPAVYATVRDIRQQR